MYRQPPRTHLTDPLFPSTTLFRSYRFPSKLQRWYTSSIVPDQSIISVVYNPNDKLVYIGTNVDGGMGIEQPPGVEAKLVVWDPATRTVVRTIVRSEEHTSELQSLMRTSYAVFCLKKKTTQLD